MPRLSMPRWSALSLRTKGLIVVTLPVVPGVVFWLLVGLALVRPDPPANTATRMRAVQVDLAGVARALAEAEAEAAQAAIGHPDAAGARIEQARAEIERHLARLEDGLLDDEARTSLGRLQPLARGALAELERAVDEAARGDESGARAAVAAVAGNRRGLRDLLRAIEDRQIALTDAHRSASYRRQVTLVVLLLVGSVACVAGGFAASAALMRSVRRRADVLMDQASRLSGGAVIPDVDVGDDEIGQLGARLREISILLRQREQALRDASRSFDRFFNLSRDLFCIAGLDGYFKRLNPAWSATLGYPLEALQAKPFLDWVHPDDRDRTLGEVASLAEGREALSFENRYRHADGSYRWLLWMARPEPAEGLIYASARDVTASREAMERLADANAALEAQAAQLEAANRELEAFSYSVSHDLRAPLRAIDGFAQVIDEDHGHRLDQSGRDALARVRSAAQRMGTLIDELLNLSRLSRMEMVRETVDVSALAAGVAAELREREPARNIEVRVEPGMRVAADPRMLRIAFENLLDNAWKYTRRTGHPEIEIGLASTEPVPVFHVRDNGAGFDMRYASRLFGAFQRLHSERDFEGTGIGLATVQRIVRRHGGRIWAEAAPDAGAVFYFTLESSFGRTDAQPHDSAGRGQSR